MKLQRVMSLSIKAIKKYGMIKNGDRIAVGVSGGKDSITLLIMLKNLQKFLKYEIEIEAITVDLGFPNANFDKIQELCDQLEIRYTVCKTDIGDIIFNIRKEKNPCSLCSKMRKGALNEKAAELGCNKIALGHNKDDVIETFFMSLLYEGRIHTFPAVTYLDRTKLEMIRPLIYMSEMNIKGFLNRYHYTQYIVKSDCPANGNTKREEIKNLVTEFKLKYDKIEEKMIGAIEKAGIDGYKE